MPNRLLGAALALMLFSGPALAGPHTLTFIGLANGANDASDAFSVNNAGQVLGSDINLSPTLGYIW